MKKDISKIIAHGNELKIIYNNNTEKNICITELDLYTNQINIYSNNYNFIIKKNEWSNFDNFEKAMLGIDAIKINSFNVKKKKDFDFLIDVVDEIVN